MFIRIKLQAIQENPMKGLKSQQTPKRFGGKKKKCFHLV